MKSISSFSRRIGIAFIYIAIASSIIGGIMYMTSVIALPEITLNSETLNTTTTTLVLNNDSYVINFTINNYDLPYQLIIGNGSTTHNLTAENTTIITQIAMNENTNYTIGNGDVAVITLDPGTAGRAGEFDFMKMYCDGYTLVFTYDTENDFLKIYNGTTMIASYEDFEPPTVYINISKSSVIVYGYYSSGEEGEPLVINADINKVMIYKNEVTPGGTLYRKAESINYYVDNNLIDQSDQLKTITYINDNLYLDNNVIVDNFTIRTLQSSYPITLYYYNNTSVNLGIILNVIGVLFGILLFVKSAGYLGVRL